ncbi:MAG: cytochrome c biogenesis protein CcdA [Bryobacterales bacterium]|nr:protein-disulfide reductase DsbD family protein [Bryobacteraceae bacterium]MDW8355056.1 cytochrome c biogenesis protein CcdA [Bryobacterales bacterium]
MYWPRTRPRRRTFRLAALTLFCGVVAPLGAQRLDPVKWSLSLEPPVVPPGAKVLARLVATIEPGWYLYSLSTPAGGPIPTTLKLADHPAIARYRVYQPPPKRKFDPNFNLDVEAYENKVEFLLEVELSSEAPAGPLELAAQARYQACDAKQCLLPVRRTATATLRIDALAAAPNVTLPPGYLLFEPSRAAAAPPPAPSAPPQAGGLALFLAVAFGFGLAAVFTPCVFPMIPITVSFFVHQQAGSRTGSLGQAVLFCLGIIVLFSALGLATTAALGPFGAQQLASSPWVNGFIALVFFVFGLSLLGAFELTIPSGILTRLDRASQRGGSLGTLLMGLTFSLTAFACVGPFVGTLLAGSLTAGGLRPLAGMVSFAAGLALPFFLLALFPSYLKRLPKSGGWMARVKIVLGFVVLAVMLKYWSNVDAVMQWNVLTRERFLAAWVVLFALPGLYLLGFLRMEGVRGDEPLGVGRLMVGVAFLVFSFSLIPGMFGARLGELDAYVPPPSASGVGGAASAGPVWLKNQYRQALEQARAEGKLVLVSFTGYACTNCHWMKANMFPRPEIAARLKDFVLVELYTDGTDAASEENQRLLESRFGTTAIPYYAILDPDERVRATFAGLTRDTEEFLAFLQSPSTATINSAR